MKMSDTYVTSQIEWGGDKWELSWDGETLTNQIIPKIQQYTIPQKLTANLDKKEAYDLIFKLNVIGGNWQDKPLIPVQYLDKTVFNSKSLYLLL